MIRELSNDMILTEIAHQMSRHGEYPMIQARLRGLAKYERQQLMMRPSVRPPFGVTLFEDPVLSSDPGVFWALREKAIFVFFVLFNELLF